MSQLSSATLLYLQEITDHLNTVAIKFTPFETILNNLPSYVGIEGFDESDKITYPYYRILAGDTTFATEPIYGYSPNQQTEVLLTPENIVDNPDIVEFYRNAANLRTIVNRYQNDQFIVRRALNPVVDIQAAISANNLTILTTTYQDNYLNDDERASLVDFMQDMLTQLDYRWYINTFEFEDNYPLAFWGMLWSLLPYLLFTKRMLNIKTSNVHPYHIWAYLSSLGFSSYQGYLSRSQELYLYRNAAYLKWNGGKEFLIDILEGVFLTPLRYGISLKTIVSTTFEREPTRDKYPDVVPISSTIDAYGGSTSFENLLTDIYNAGGDNRKDVEYVGSVIDKFRRSPTNKLATKFMEISSNIDMSELTLLIRFIIDSVVYLQTQHKLKFSVNVVSPATQEVHYFDNVIDALNVVYYCIYAKQGITLDLPTFTKCTLTAAISHTRKPTVPKYLTVDGIQYFVTSYVDLDTAVNDVPYINSTIFTPEDLSIKLGKQYSWIFSMIHSIDNVSDTVENELLAQVLRLVVPTIQVIDVTQTRHTYRDFFTRYPAIYDEFSMITDDDPLYDKFIYNVVTAICPFEYGFAAIAQTDNIVSIIVGKIKELFTYLVSYNITFLDRLFDETYILKIPKLTLDVVMGIESDTTIGSMLTFYDKTIDTMDIAATMSVVSSDSIDLDISLDAELIDGVGDTAMTIDQPIDLDLSVEAENAIYITDYGVSLAIETTITDPQPP